MLVLAFPTPAPLPRPAAVVALLLVAPLDVPLPLVARPLAVAPLPTAPPLVVLVPALEAAGLFIAAVAVDRVVRGPLTVFPTLRPAPLTLVPAASRTEPVAEPADATSGETALEMTLVRKLPSGIEIGGWREE